MTIDPPRPFAELATALLTRRRALGGGMAFGLLSAHRPATAQPAAGSLAFTEVAPGLTTGDAVAPGYNTRIVLRWGDPVLPGAPAFDPAAQTGARQAAQFGTNNDFLAFLPLPPGSDTSDHGLLWANHEYSSPHMMFPGVEPAKAVGQATAETVAVEMNAIGGSIVELRRTGGQWRVVPDSAYARRITLAGTSMRLAGPAAGHPRLRTKADPTGASVMGTACNCSGGVTPWGTVLSGEENIHFMFSGESLGTPEERNHRRMGIGGAGGNAFGRFHDRFHLGKELNEPNRFGWVVEIDPYEPQSVPVKRTALGRFKHEGATVWVNPNGTVTVYMGDDERGQYLYKFVSIGRFDPANRAANRALLDEGTLYAAQFHADGTVKWLPLIFGQGPLTPLNWFESQADVLIEARRAAMLLRATPMDRPEDVETDPVTGRAYVVLTNNRDRKPDQADKANPRAANIWGHILELVVPGEGKGADHAVLEHKWDVFLMGGPADQGGTVRPGLPANVWPACPDNIAFDNAGRLWFSTDQGGEQRKFGIGDGLWATETSGPARAVSRFFYRVPTGAELCGPCFTPDNRTLFVAVQHPGEDDPGSTFDKPTTRWPDNRPDMPPRSAVVAITRADGGIIGG